MRETPLTRKDFQRLAELRAREAGALLRTRNPMGSYYLSGYAVECALKACIAKQAGRHEFPPKPDYVRRQYTHDLKELLRLADLQQQLDEDMERSPALAKNWSIVKTWDENARYQVSGLNGRDFYDAIIGSDGVLLWIKQRW
ncbi:MAG: DNA-binding protein [Terriglobales bacterium]|jgi:HEPN domain-containing protein